ncbi:MAG: hypothetical protein OK456_04105 [Thaumarchaeota archaeon]|nr:hypothetical protein [Nitrososphaerota archaeon]
MSTTTPAETKAPPRSTNSMILVVVIVVVVALALGATVYKSSGSTPYACTTLDRQGNNVLVTTSGIVHVSSTGHYYISCSEGSPLPVSGTTVSCLTVMAQLETSSYPGAASTYFYYLSSTTGAIALQGAGVNATEVTAPSSASILVTC